jgi:hypothetical protein
MRHDVIIPDWIDFDGSACPVDPDMLIKVQFTFDADRAEAERYEAQRASWYDWSLTGSGRIVAYRPVLASVVRIEPQPRPLLQIAAPWFVGFNSRGMDASISLSITISLALLVALAVMA